MKHLGGIIVMYLYFGLLSSIPVLMNYIESKVNPEETKLSYYKGFAKDMKVWSVSSFIVFFIIATVIAVSLQFGECK